LRPETTSLAGFSHFAHITRFASLPGWPLRSGDSRWAGDRKPSVRSEHDQLAFVEDEDRRAEGDVAQRLDLIEPVHDEPVGAAPVIDRMNGHQVAHEPRRRGASAWMMSR
jgi:hypothetical protein